MNQTYNLQAKKSGKCVVVALGTRPDATKMAPVIYSLRKCPGVEPFVLATGQHLEQLESALSIFDIQPDINLNVMRDSQTLQDLVSRIVPAASKALNDLNTSYVLVHGDTITGFCVALAAFFMRLPIGHVEAGLRSGNLDEPFPEEANRRLVSVLADMHFAPTSESRNNLLLENINSEKIIVTGQTAVDGIKIASERSTLPSKLCNKNIITVTMHRRENLPIMTDLAQALAQVAHAHPKYTFVYPVHLNPAVRNAVIPILEQVTNFHLIDPLSYGEMAAVLKASTLIITDSGGLQEEGASLGVPVVVLRNVTERPEGIASGVLRLAGSNPKTVFQVINNLLSDQNELIKMKNSRNPFGDGYASERIAAAVVWRLGLGNKPQDWIF